MATSTTGSGNKPSIGLPLIIVAVVVLIGVMVLLYRANFGPPKPPPMTAAAQQRDDNYKALAMKCHGDISQLSPQEQATVMQQTGGHAAQMLRAYYAQGSH